MKVYEQRRHWLWALDPLHVGSGKQQISRIDLPVVREEGTGLPVVPGTSLTGVCRAYAALSAGPNTENGKLCSGKGGQEGMDHCGKCDVCRTFGFSRGNESSRQGLAQIFTAHILFFPIATTSGPVWITSWERLITCGAERPDGAPEPGSGQFIAIKGDCWQTPHDFGWLALSRHTNGAITLGQTTYPVKTVDGAREEGKIPSEFFDSSTGYVKKLALVSDDLFITLVNSNMEVRTLVSINPLTGAAEDKALFTYEAIPRGALMWFDVVVTNPGLFGLAEISDQTVHNTLKNGFDLMEYLGLGGMNTRGMGRVRILNGAAPDACEQQEQETRRVEPARA